MISWLRVGVSGQCVISYTILCRYQHLTLLAASNLPLPSPPLPSPPLPPFPHLFFPPLSSPPLSPPPPSLLSLTLLYTVTANLSDFQFVSTLTPMFFSPPFNNAVSQYTLVMPFLATAPRFAVYIYIYIFIQFFIYIYIF